jgi:hypothetical protein
MSGTAPLSPDGGWVGATNYADRISGDFDELKGKYYFFLRCKSIRNNALRSGWLQRQEMEFV